MKINGIYRYTAIRRYPNNHTLQLDKGVVNGKELDIYSVYEKNSLLCKLYLLSSQTGKWLKAKFKEVRNG